jgi:hypothetical protein
MKLTPIIAGFCVAAIPAVAAPLAPDEPITFGSSEAVCTGVGSAQDNPQWAAYPIRMVFSNAGGQFVSGVHIALSTAAGRAIGQLDCNTPWALLKLPRGSYKATVRLNETGAERSMNFTSTGAVQAAGFNIDAQKRLEFQFPLPANR